MALAQLLRRFDFLKGTDVRFPFCLCCVRAGVGICNLHCEMLARSITIQASELELHGAITLTPVTVPVRIVKRQ